MRAPSVENTSVALRYDPFDVSKGYAYIHGQWRPCVTSYTELAGCSERELQLLAAELRKRHRLLYGRAQVEITQKQLADFRRENAALEVILRQQRHDRETKAALSILEGGPCGLTALLPLVRQGNFSHRPEMHLASHATGDGDKLVVLRRIR